MEYREALRQQHLRRLPVNLLLLLAGPLEGGVWDGLRPATTYSLQAEFIIAARWPVGGLGLVRPCNTILA